MDKETYAITVRSMHRIFGWTCIASIIFSPIGILVLRRGNRIYRNIMSSGDEWGSSSSGDSLIMSFDDFTAIDPDQDQ